MSTKDKGNSPEASRMEPFTTPNSLSRRDFFSKAAAAGAGTFLVAKGANEAHAQFPGLKPGLVPQQFAPVSPTLKLSAKALQAPFTPVLKWLPEVRSFLTRTNDWVNHRIDLGEMFIMRPAAGVVGLEGAIIWESSLGFGDISAFANSFGCGNNDCESQGIVGTCAGEDKCGTQWCGSQGCSLDSCDNNSCSTQTCDNLKCGENTTGFTSFVGEIESNWSHPFVQELATYFQINSFDTLARAVQHYVGRNMYDASAIRLIR